MALFYAQRRAPSMGNIFEDAWEFVKENPLVVVPPLYLGQKTIEAGAKVLSAARTEVQQTVAAFRPPAPQSSVQALQQQLVGSGGPGGEPSSSPLPIIVGAVAAGGLLLLAFGRRRRHT